MTLSCIVAADLNNGIGKDNQLLWHIPADLKYFKSVTMGKPVIMGRKTYESIGRPLPGRRNLIISLSSTAIEGCEVFSSIDDALAAVKEEKEAFIIGGAEIYKQTLGMADQIYLTRVFSEFEADVFFPEIKSGIWELLFSTGKQIDEKSGLEFCFITYKRKDRLSRY
ncbi:MAG: dihydrofolate reductase [Flavobacteriales bacterium]